MSTSNVTTDDLRRLLKVIEEGHSLESLEEFPDFTVTSLPTVVPCDVAGYNEVDVEMGRLVTHMNPDVRFPGTEETFGRLIHQHPLVMRYAATEDGRAFKISDFLTQDEFHATDIYQEVYRRIGAEYQIAVNVPSPRPIVIGLAFNRQQRDFDERDREVLNLARPHVEHIHRRLKSRAQLSMILGVLNRAVDTLSQGLVVVDDAGFVNVASGLAGELVREFTGERLRQGQVLPPSIAAWVEGQRTGFDGDFVAPPPAEALVLSRGHERLVGRYLPALKAGEPAVIVLEREGPFLTPDSISSLALTPRQREILIHVAAGRSNADVARLSGVSERTVAKHLEHIYASLGVSSRTAAVARALEAARSQSERRPDMNH